MTETVITDRDRKTLEMFEEFLDRLQEDSNLDKKYLNQIKREINDAWSQTKYPKSEVMKFVFITSLLISSLDENIEIAKRMLEESKIRLTPKDKKRGKVGILNRFLRSYHKEQIRENLKRDLLDRVLTRHTEDLRKKPTLAQLREKIKKLGIDSVQIMVYCMIQDQKLISLIEKHFPMETLEFNVRNYIGLKRLNFERVMEEPELLVDQTDYVMLKRKTKELERKLSKTQMQASHLRKELHMVQQKEKELKSEVYHLNQEVEKTYEQAIAEIGTLKKQLAEKEELFQQEREFYIATIANLCREDDEEQDFRNEDIDLTGKTICVIGGSRERHYREIIEKYNGQIEFVSSDDFNKISGAVSRSDAVFFLKDILRHALFFEALQCSRQSNVPFIFVNTLGVTTFERELKKYALKR
jgi:hypothetical protein